jgi:hypothetical protein
LLRLLQQYVEELRSCLAAEGADEALTPAALHVVKLANEIVRTPHLLCFEPLLCTLIDPV